MAGRQKEVIIDEVHQNQILRELYLKELRTQKLYTEYRVNPLLKVHTITRKPMSWHDNLEEPEDARFLNLLHHAALGPRKKYPETQTESQEIGWDSEPLHQQMWLFSGVCWNLCLWGGCTTSTKCPPSWGTASPHVAQGPLGSRCLFLGIRPSHQRSIRCVLNP
ncbi:cilia- and flagella-associated protein 144 isoform X2 [Acinonyx jubatus]|uniref:Cilia- and flagella-associated protein 144 isoform X2 n=1 Tax=Acinonyx jubatus TaxID=32536 RepID=A0ABM3PAG6_ACIJB|nr:cilia- and flagella-associated protein 144 isoform X2 [Acinonyx jubatus]